VPDRLHFTESDEANALIAADPLALLVGFVLDQQVTVQKAFAGPLAIKERLGAFDAATLAGADLDAVFREKPAVHRYLVPWHPTLGDVDSAQALTDYQAAKRIHKAEWTKSSKAPA
jgi:hypothetical protein